MATTAEKIRRLSHYLRSHDRTAGHLLYDFPSGQSVSVIPDPRRPLLWEILVDGEAVPEPGLTTEEALARLFELAAQPAASWSAR